MSSHRWKGWALPTRSPIRNVVSPSLSLWVGQPQGRTIQGRVKDRGASERRPVMGRIGVATLPHAKAGRLPRGVGVRERSINHFQEVSRPVGGSQRPQPVRPPRAQRASAAQAGWWHRLGIAQADLKANEAAVSRKGWRRPAEPRRFVPRRGAVQCLSRMRGNLPVRFLYTFPLMLSGR